MKRISFFILSVLAVVTLLALGAFLSIRKPAAKRPPNIVLIFMDDMGYGDLNSYGAYGYNTPNLDRLAMEGMRFTHFYAAQAVCSASRAALLTGCYPNRVGIAGALMPWAKTGLHSEETTIAELLRQKNYTTGIFGKWHLGHQREFLPLQHGFDEYFGLPYSNDMWPVYYDGKPHDPVRHPNRAQYPVLPLIDGNDKVDEVTSLEAQALLTARYTERAVQFIQKNRNQPFFLYLPHSMPHVPIAASKRFRGKSPIGLYGDVMEEIDWSVGEVLNALKKNRLDENTLVIFTSDNGPWLNFGNHAGSSGGLRQGKGSSWEGGQRVPCIVRWPGVVPGGTVCHKMAATIDIYTTLAAITGAALPNTRKIDGVNILPLLKGEPGANPRTHFFYYYNRNDLEAVRKDHWKLMLPHKGRTYMPLPGNDGFPGATPNDTVHLALYDLRRDPAETYDTKEQHPDIVKQLLELAETARQDLGDALTKRDGANVRKAGSLDISSK
ncbi:sulfatase [Nibrella saemangeumensis]|uniref:Sulfatase n=1 Tax=Nibrella saemangeumensis TaxID=1084526 RepID=A0ABP8MCE1_9BACT